MGEIDRERAPRAASGRVHRCGARVREQVEEPRTVGHVPDEDAGVAMVEEQACVEVPVQIDLEGKPVLLHLDDEGLPALRSVLAAALITLAHLAEGMRGLHAANHRRDSEHVLETTLRAIRINR